MANRVNLGFGLEVDFTQLINEDEARQRRAKDLRVEATGQPNVYLVTNALNGNQYHVYADSTGMKCGCKAFEFGKGAECKHCVAVDGWLWRRSFLARERELSSGD